MLRRHRSNLALAVLVLMLAPSAAWGAAAPLRPPPSEYTSCNPELPALAMVADLHHVSMRTACRLTIKIQHHVPPADEGNRISSSCWNPFLHVHHFRGWRLHVRNNNYATMRRGRSSFAFMYQEGPLLCI